MPITPDDERHGGRPRLRYTKRRLIFHISEQTGIPKHTVRNLMNGLGAILTTGIYGNNGVYIPNLGGFYQITKKSHTGTNPRTGAPIFIPSKKSVRFQAGITLKISI